VCEEAWMQMVLLTDAGLVRKAELKIWEQTDLDILGSNF
jgi:hypothetical protein